MSVGVGLVALVISVPVVAEVVWIFPAEGIHVNFSNFFGVCIGEGVLWLDPENGSHVGPARHIAAVDEDDEVFIE